MTDLIVNQSKIWEFVGGVSAMSGLVCFAQGSTYNMSFGKLGFGGHFVYLLVCLIVWCLIVGAKRIRVSEKVQGVVAALIFVAISLISVVHDQLVAGKSDALTIISYGLFALMSVSMSRKYELGFEIGFSAFFLQLFAAQLFKIKRILLPIALVFCSLIIILRHHSESGVLSAPPNIDDEESQYSQGQSLLSTTNQENNPEESSEATNHSPSNGQVSDQGSIFDLPNPQNDEQDSVSAMPHSPSNYGPQVSSDWENEQNREQEEVPSLSLSAAHHAPINNGEVSEESILEVVWDNQQNNDQEENRLSFPAGSSDSSGNNQNDYVHSSPPPQLRRRRRMRMTPALQNIASRLEDGLRRFPRTHLLFFFFFENPRC